MKRRTNYHEYMSYYTSTSQAYALDGYSLRRDAPPEPVYGPRREKRERSKKSEPINRKPKSKPAAAAEQSIKLAGRKKPIYEKVPSNTKFFSERLIITLVLIFFGLVATTMSSATLRKSQAEYNALRAEYVELQDEEASLRAKIAEEYDAVHIERMATTRLNMSKPKSHQMVYIYLPAQDYVVQYGIKDYDEPGGFWGRFNGILNSARSALSGVIPR